MTERRGLKYATLAEELRRSILAGSWVPGEQLPTQEQLATSRGLSLTSVRRAIDDLVDEGLVERRQGAGTFVRPFHRPPRPRGREVGVLVPDITAYYPRIMLGIESALVPAGARVHFATYDNDADRQDEALDRLLDEAIDGLILTPQLNAWPDPTALLERLGRRVPVVLLERRLAALGPADPTEHVRSDHRAGAIEAVNHLAGMGHSKIGLLVREQVATTPEVREGYRWAMARAGLGPYEWTATKQEWPGRIHDALDELRTRRISAVLVLGDQEGILLEDAALASGLRVPGDLAIVSYDDETAHLAPVPLTAVAPPKYRLGRIAAMLILDRIDEGEVGPVHQIVIRPRLIRRSSSGPPGWLAPAPTSTARR